MGCHPTKDGAIDQGVAIALAEDSTFEGERSEKRELPDNYRPATSDDVPEGRACGNCIFFNEERLNDEGQAWCERWDAFADGGAYCNAWEPRADEDDDDDDEVRQVDLTPPAYMRASARRGLEWHREGLSGDGVVDRTIREAEAMGRGVITADKWVRLRAWISRHLVDMDAPANIPGAENYPGPGAVAMALWGGGGSKRSAERALAYADGVVGRLEAENEGRAKGEALSKLETRIVEVDKFEVREDASGMFLEGYAALFNSRSENLGGFTETIKPGAFRASLKARNDIKLLWNHDTGAVMGSTRAGTLTLTEDERGLRVSATLPDTTYGRDARELVRRGDVTGFSFGFSMPARGGDEWSADGTERVLKSVRLHEVSLVAFPAYPETNGTATVRGLDKIAQRANVDADALADALLKIENGEDISSDDRTLLQTVINELAPEAGATEPAADNSLEMLALKKKKLQVLMGY
jgi:HK97 family phage prohead protease